MTRALEERVFLTLLHLHKAITPGNAGHKCRLDVQSQSTRMRHTRMALSRVPSGPSAAGMGRGRGPMLKIITCV